MATSLSVVPPRGTVDYGKSGHRDVTSNYESALLQWRDQAREEAISNLQLNAEYERSEQYQKYLLGDQWSRRRPIYRSKYVDNRIAQARIERLALLTDIRPVIDVSCSVKEYGPQAEIARKVILHSWQRERIDLKLISVVDQALFGQGFWKIGALSPGRMIINTFGMDAVLEIQPAFDMQESMGVMYRTYKPPIYFWNQWGATGKCDGLEREQAVSSWSDPVNSYTQPQHLNELTWNAMSPEMRHNAGLAASPKARSSEMIAFPSIPLEEYWIDDPSVNESQQEVIVRDPDKALSSHNYWYRVAPGERLFPRKRLIVFAGDRVMYDGPSPYWHGLYPFARLILNPITWGPGGIAAYRNLMPGQDLLNEVGAGMADRIKRAMNPTLITKEGAVRDADWRAFSPDKPGGKLKTTPVAQVGDIRYVDPPSLPGDILPFMQNYLQPSLERHSGTLDPTQLSRKKQAPAADSVESMKDGLQAGFRLEGRYIEAFLGEAGIQAVSNIFQFWTREQRVRLLGADGQTYEDFDFKPGSMVPYTQPQEDHWKLFAFEVGQGTLLGSPARERKMIALQLFKMGGISIRELHRALDLQNSSQIMKEMEEEHELGLKEKGGRTPRSSTAQKAKGSPI
jgi:hypothetical protein